MYLGICSFMLVLKSSQRGNFSYRYLYTSISHVIYHTLIWEIFSNDYDLRECKKGIENNQRIYLYSILLSMWKLFQNLCKFIIPHVELSGCHQELEGPAVPEAEPEAEYEDWEDPDEEGFWLEFDEHEEELEELVMEEKNWMK